MRALFSRKLRTDIATCIQDMYAAATDTFTLTEEWQPSSGPVVQCTVCKIPGSLCRGRCIAYHRPRFCQQAQRFDFRHVREALVETPGAYTSPSSTQYFGSPDAASECSESAAVRRMRTPPAVDVEPRPEPVSLVDILGSETPRRSSGSAARIDIDALSTRPYSPANAATLSAATLMLATPSAQRRNTDVSGGSRCAATREDSFSSPWRAAYLQPLATELPLPMPDHWLRHPRAVMRKRQLSPEEAEAESLVDAMLCSDVAALDAQRDVAAIDGAANSQADSDSEKPQADNAQGSAPPSPSSAGQPVPASGPDLLEGVQLQLCWAACTGQCTARPGLRDECCPAPRIPRLAWVNRRRAEVLVASRGRC